MLHHNDRRLRIVRRAYGGYAYFACYIGGCLGAIAEAGRFERRNSDGRYLVRGLDEPNRLPGGACRSGLDWL
jgi:hypothetical protein